MQHFYYFLGQWVHLKWMMELSLHLIPIALKTVWMTLLACYYRLGLECYGNSRPFLLSFLYLHCMKATPGPPFSRGVWAFLTPTIYIVKYTWATVMSTIFSCQKCKAFCYNKYLFLEVIVYQAFHFDGFFVK